jgi:hypothetical protein
METKLKEVCNSEGLIGYSFMCPGCKHFHIYYVQGNLCWQFNGNIESPTFTPSLLNTWVINDRKTSECCHLNLTNGIIHFHEDCTHELAGKNIKLD